jgi:hypothetical protein
MNFNLSDYIRHIGFIQTRESDKRDIFEKEYNHPFYNKTYNAVVTLYYDAGYSNFNSLSMWLLTIELYTGEKSVLTLFNGLAPTTFDQAADLFELTMPSPEFLKSKEPK